MIFILDNYDSFTFNLVQELGTLGARMEVFRNDALTVEAVLARRPSGVLISPGPCSPAEAGISVELIRRCAGVVPVLGVCLGHQAIGAAFGGRVVRNARIVHGKASAVRHRRAGVFRDVPSPFRAGRYHSLVVERASLPLPCASPRGPTKEKSWACATRATTSRACSFTRSPSSPSTGARCWAPGSRAAESRPCNEPHPLRARRR